MSQLERPSDEFITLLKKSGDSDQNVAYAAQREFAKALELPLRKGVLVGNILGDILPLVVCCFFYDFYHFGIEIQCGCFGQFDIELYGYTCKIA